MQGIQIWTNEEGSYTLLDSGEGRKLEQIGDTTLIRDEPRAWWKPTLSKEEWDKAQAVYVRESGWKFKKGVSQDFEVKVLELTARVKLTKMSKHIGIFPEQMGQWKWIQDKVKKAGRPIKILNLFGYTGMASLAAARAGAEVTHVDGSKASIAWARENQEASKLGEKPIRWILDDAATYMRREAKRGVRYDGIIMDPPSYGKGPKGEVWKIEKELPGLLELGKEVLSDNPLFFILNMYSTELSSISLYNLLSDTTSNLGGNIQIGELALKHKTSERLLPLSIFALWHKD